MSEEEIQQRVVAELHAAIEGKILEGMFTAAARRPRPTLESILGEEYQDDLTYDQLVYIQEAILKPPCLSAG